MVNTSESTPQGLIGQQIYLIFMHGSIVNIYREKRVCQAGDGMLRFISYDISLQAKESM